MPKHAHFEFRQVGGDGRDQERGDGEGGDDGGDVALQACRVERVVERSARVEFGSALGVAVSGTVFTARFVAALPPDVRAGHDPHTMAQALAATTPDRASEVIAAFVSAADTGLRVVGATVLVLGGLVLLQALLAARPGWARPRRVDRR